MAVELRHLKAFRAVAQELSFRAASDRLGIAQPAISRTIKELEETAGVRLLERTTRVVRLTDAGRWFLDQSNDILERLDNAVQMAWRIELGYAGKLAVGFNEFATKGNLLEIVRRYRAAYPDVELSLVEGSTPEMVDHVLDGDLAIAFHIGPFHHEDIDQVVLREERLVCVVPDSHRLAAQEDVSIMDLVEESFILTKLPRNALFHRAVEKFFRPYGFQPRVVQSVTHNHGPIEFVAAGIGISLYFDSEPLRDTRGIKVLPFREQGPRFTTVASWRRGDRKNSANLEKFVGIIDEVLKNQKGPRKA